MCAPARRVRRRDIRGRYDAIFGKYASCAWTHPRTHRHRASRPVCRIRRRLEPFARRRTVASVAYYSATTLAVLSGSLDRTSVPAVRSVAGIYNSSVKRTSHEACVMRRFVRARLSPPTYRMMPCGTSPVGMGSSGRVNNGTGVYDSWLAGEKVVLSSRRIRSM